MREREAAEEFDRTPRQRIGRVAEADAALSAAEQRPVADEASAAASDQAVGVHAPRLAQRREFCLPERGIGMGRIVGECGLELPGSSAAVSGRKRGIARRR